MTFKKRLLVLIYLLTACTLGMNFFIVLILCVIRLFFWVMLDLPFEIPVDDLIKYSKAATFTGIIIAFGCWWIYFQRYRNSRKL